MAEFFILPEFRRRGIVFTCAINIFRKHPGKWEIRFNKHNIPSRSLWNKLADNVSKGTVSAGQLDLSHDYIRFSVYLNQKLE